MQDELDKTQKIVDDLLGHLERCLDVALVLALLSVVMIIVGGIVGGSTDGNTWSDGVSAGAAAGSSMLNAWSSYCKLISLYYEAQLTAQEIPLWPLAYSYYKYTRLMIFEPTNYYLAYHGR